VNDRDPEVKDVGLERPGMDSFVKQTNQLLRGLNLNWTASLQRDDEDVRIVFHRAHQDRGCYENYWLVPVTIIMRTRSIVGEKATDVPGWLVQTGKYYPGTQWDLPDYDVADVAGPHTSIATAIGAVVGFVLEEHLQVLLEADRIEREKLPSERTGD